MSAKGSFTLPGETGYEELTLQMAEKWGADMIRDSDGTSLSDDILSSDYGIYSTICVIRDHNEWAKEHEDCLQQTFLMTSPKTTSEKYITVFLLDDFSREQFRVNDTADAMKYWQVFDRTTGEEIQPAFWTYDKDFGSVTIQNVLPLHRYTVSFLAYRIWEEISMYNYLTNGWSGEHMMQIDPVYPEVQEFLTQWMDKWCREHTDTDVVRFTSMFYNFVWIWGADTRLQNVFTDWGSYDFTASIPMLEGFRKKYGYALCAEDFINKGAFQVTHMPPTSQKKDYMEYVGSFVRGFGRKLVDIVHSYGKKAYVFYDDSWIGTEPCGRHFREFGFDGLIKCVFSGYEARLCAGVDVPVHELRLHPYLFPVGLGGAPTFAKGGSPTMDAKKYWRNIRRALLRQKIDRIGLGGYLHLVEDFPDFCDYIEDVADEFRSIKKLHESGAPFTFPCRVAVLHCWGALRPWTLSGHFHETCMHDLIHIDEALAGMPVEVSFIDFDDVRRGSIQDINVIINAGAAGSAWSGGDAWKDTSVVDIITAWVQQGGTFIGVNEPSAVPGFDDYFRMSSVLGVDEDRMEYICHGKWKFTGNPADVFGEKKAPVPLKARVHLTDGRAEVLKTNDDGCLLMTRNKFGHGQGIYMSGFEFSNESERMLMNILLDAAHIDPDAEFITDNPNAECTYFPASDTLAVINNSEYRLNTTVRTYSGEKSFELAPYETILEGPDKKVTD